MSGGREGIAAFVRAAVVLLMGALLVVACASPAPPAPPPPPPPPPTPTGTPQEQALAWTSAVCSALIPLTVQLTAPPRFNVNDPAATRQAYSVYLGEGLAATDRAREALAATGPAPVPGGDAIAEQVRGDVADLRANLLDAKNQVDQVDPNNPIALGRTVLGIAGVVNALLNGAAVVRTLNQDPALRAAYTQAPSCQQLQNAGATASPTPPPTVVEIPPTR
jgi:hypothetical protein